MTFVVRAKRKTQNDYIFRDSSPLLLDAAVSSSQNAEERRNVVWRQVDQQGAHPVVEPQHHNCISYRRGIREVCAVKHHLQHGRPHRRGEHVLMILRTERK